MNHIKNFKKFNEELEFPDPRAVLLHEFEYFKYGVKDFEFVVTNGGASTGTEYGSVTIIFTKDGEESEIQFDMYQVAGGSDTISFIEIQDIETAKELGIEVAEKDRVGEDDELFGIIYDAYDSKSEGEDGEYMDMEYRIENVSADGVVEEGWLEISITKGEQTIDEVSFDIRQDSNSDMNATFNSDEDEEKCKSLGIELDEEFETEIITAYDSYTSQTRP